VSLALSAYVEGLRDRPLSRLIGKQTKLLRDYRAVV
jgi:hypothetical protein